MVRSANVHQQPLCVIAPELLAAARCTTQEVRRCCAVEAEFVPLFFYVHSILVRAYCVSAVDATLTTVRLPR